MGTYFEHGSWNVICDVCGRKYKASEMRKRWDGFIVCKQDFEVRHSLDFIRVRGENVSVPFTRPDADLYVREVTCSVSQRNCRADFGAADCATVDFITDEYENPFPWLV